MQKSPHAKTRILCFLASATLLGTSVFMTGQTYALETVGTPVAVAAASGQNAEDNLVAAIYSVHSQIPEIDIYINLDDATEHLYGSTSAMEVSPSGNIEIGAGPSGQWTNLVDRIVKSGIILEDDVKNKTYDELIAIAKQAPAYGVDNEFKTVVDAAEGEYQSGIDMLREYLPQADQSLTDLDTKTGVELLAIYNNLPAVKDKKYQDLMTGLGRAAAVNAAYAEGSISRNIVDKVAGEVYNELVAAAKVIDPNFEVKAPVIDDPSTESSEAKQPSGDSSSGNKSVPGAPKAGNVNSKETSAENIGIAVAYLVGFVVVIGVAINVRRYLFSPLKRRK